VPLAGNDDLGCLRRSRVYPCCLQLSGAFLTDLSGTLIHLWQSGLSSWCSYSTRSIVLHRTVTRDVHRWRKFVLVVAVRILHDRMRERFVAVRCHCSIGGNRRDQFSAARHSGTRPQHVPASQLGNKPLADFRPAAASLESPETFLRKRQIAAREHDCTFFARVCVCE
jgi:hypothetical protein